MKARAQPGCGSPLELAITRHGSHLHSSGSEELAYLGGVLNYVQRHAADYHSVHCAVISMGIREWPSRHLLGELLKRSAHPPAAVVDVIEEFGLGEHSVGKGEGVLVKGLWRFPRLELGGEVVIEGSAARGTQGTRGLSRAIPRVVSGLWVPRLAKGPSPIGHRDSPSGQPPSAEAFARSCWPCSPQTGSSRLTF